LWETKVTPQQSIALTIYPGAPTTLGQAQAKLKQSPIGYRMKSHQLDLQKLLGSSASESLYEYAVFVHSVWYLPSAEELQPMLAALRGRTRHPLIAEYSLDIRGDNAALLHVLAAIPQAEFNSRDGTLDRSDNIQSIVSPQIIRALALKAGWELQKEDVVEPPADQEDARWEVNRACSENYRVRSRATGGASRQGFAEVLLLAVEESTRAHGPSPKFRTMPTWLGSWVWMPLSSRLLKLVNVPRVT
jgi:hypothetical protein